MGDLHLASQEPGTRFHPKGDPSIPLKATPQKGRLKKKQHTHVLFATKKAEAQRVFPICRDRRQDGGGVLRFRKARVLHLHSTGGFLQGNPQIHSPMRC